MKLLTLFNTASIALLMLWEPIVLPSVVVMMLCMYVAFKAGPTITIIKDLKLIVFIKFDSLTKKYHQNADFTQINLPLALSYSIPLLAESMFNENVKS
ncbi:hypothetical protein [Mucilaginibacter sp. L196]|uniref:hypothetical protein n=1 Tax=Mucilaginibacter sp. L196 TaxID=1641870 RepID=UPI001C20BF4C|nr:hypothetical protein [Mucilaginibacter sp. L196]